MKKIVALLLLFSAVVSESFATNWSVKLTSLGETVVDNIKYELFDGIPYWNRNKKTVCVTGFAVDEEQMPQTINIAEEVTFDGESYPVEIVRRKAFANCKNPHEFVLPTKLWVLETQAFANCSDLKLQIKSSFMEMADSVFYDTTLTGPSDMLINVTGMTNFSFVGCKAPILVLNPYQMNPQAMSHADVPYIIMSSNRYRNYIIRQAFRECNAKEVRVAYSSNLPAQMFCDCPNLERVVFPDNDEQRSAFIYDDSYMPNVPEVEDRSIYEYAYPEREYRYNYIIVNCPSMKEVVVLSSTPPKLYVMYPEAEGPTLCGAEKSIIDNHSNVTLKVPLGSEDSYRAHPIWGKFPRIEGFTPGEYDSIDVAPSPGASAQAYVTYKTVCTNGRLNVKIDRACAVEVYNSAGKVVRRCTHNGGMLSAALPSGFYIVRTLPLD